MRIGDQSNFVRTLCRGAALAAIAALAARASAAEPTATIYSLGNDYVSVIAGLAFPSKELGTTGTGATFSGIYGVQFSPHWLAELNVQSSSFDTRPFTGIDYQNGVSFDAVYQLRDRSAGLLTPYVVAGLGVVYDDFYPNHRDVVAAGVEIGAGLLTQPLFHRGIRLRVEGRYAREQHEAGHDEPRVLLGLDFPLGHITHGIAAR